MNSIYNPKRHILQTRSSMRWRQGQGVMKWLSQDKMQVPECLSLFSFLNSIHESGHGSGQSSGPHYRCNCNRHGPFHPNWLDKMGYVDLNSENHCKEFSSPQPGKFCLHSNKVDAACRDKEEISSNKWYSCGVEGICSADDFVGMMKTV